MKIFFTILFLTILQISPAYSYIGPGMAVGVIVVVLGIIGAILLALFTVLYYPIKKTIQKFKKNKPSNHNNKKN